QSISSLKGFSQSRVQTLHQCVKSSFIPRKRNLLRQHSLGIAYSQIPLLYMRCYLYAQRDGRILGRKIFRTAQKKENRDVGDHLFRQNPHAPRGQGHFHFYERLYNLREERRRDKMNNIIRTFQDTYGHPWKWAIIDMCHVRNQGYEGHRITEVNSRRY